MKLATIFTSGTSEYARKCSTVVWATPGTEKEIKKGVNRLNSQQAIV